jgi:hypothetical protein
MAFAFNPFTGNFDLKGSGGGGGASYIDGEVAVYTDLPLDGTAAINTAWLVREASGAWLLARKPAGIYIRSATAGVSRDADYTYAGILPDVFNDANFLLYDNGDSSKNLAFQLSGITTGQTRTITVPDANITLDDAGDTRDPNLHAASHLPDGADEIFDQNLNVGDSVRFDGVTVGDPAEGFIITSGGFTSGLSGFAIDGESDAIVAGGGTLSITGDVAINNGALDFSGTDPAAQKAASRANLGLGDAAVEDTTAFAASGSITSSGLTQATARILGRTTASTGAVEEIQIGAGLSLSAGELSATGGGSGGTKTYAVFTATDNQPTATDFATLDTRNSIAVLDFDDATDESAVFVSIIPEAASLGSGLKIRLHWMATTATSGDVVWDVSLERMTTDLDSDSFDTIASGTAAANGTSGIVTVTEITLTTIDSVTAGDGFRLKVTRDANNASDTMTGDAELVVCEVRSAA